jgi:hypothetical protein
MGIWASSCNRLRSEFGVAKESTIVALEINLDPDDLSNLGPIQWDVEPPEYFWLPSKEAWPIRGEATPPLGRPYYTGWAGVPPSLTLEEIETSLDWKTLAAHFRFNCQHYRLKERLSEVV